MDVLRPARLHGGQVEAGYFLSPAWQLIARYSVTKLDHDFKVGNVGQFHEITAGVNYYMHGHSAKITVDFGWLPNGSPNSQTGIGVLANDGENEYYVRGQFTFFL